MYVQNNQAVPAFCLRQGGATIPTHVTISNMHKRWKRCAHITNARFQLSLFSENLLQGGTCCTVKARNDKLLQSCVCGAVAAAKSPL